MTQAPLLPSNASELERDLSLSSDSLNRLGSGPPKIRTGKRLDIQDDVIPWLILEYGLGELLPYIPDQRQAVREGVKWQRVRGTPAAVRTSLGWIGFDAQIEESERGSIRWADFQLGLDQAPNGLQFTENVVQVSRLSSPVRSRLFRIYGGWFDFRRFKLDDHGLSTGSWLCDHTGVYLEQDREVPWPQLSFGREIKRDASFTESFVAGGSVHRHRTDLGFYEDRLILDFNQLSELVWRTFHMDVAKACISRMHFQEWGPIWQRATNWTTAGWDSVFDWANKINAITPALKFCKAGMYLSDQDAKLGDTNACLPATDVVEVGDGPFVLSEGDLDTGFGILSEHVSRLEYQEILERFERNTDAEADHSASTHNLGDNAELYRHGETTRFVKYNDTFQLNLNLLDEFPPLLTHAAYSRNHSYSWENGWFDFDSWDSVSWKEAFKWEGNRFSLDQHFTLEAAGIYLSDSDPLEETNATFSTPFNSRFERNTDAEAIHTGSGHLLGESADPGVLSREHQRLITYNDRFQLSLNRLSEFVDLTSFQSNIRAHTTGFVQAQVQVDQWQVATQTWSSPIDWQSAGWFDLNAQNESWLSGYSWTNFPQLEQFFEETISEVELSETGAFGDLNFLLGSEFSSVSERFTQTEVNALAVQPSLLRSLDREHKRILPYNDTFELDLNLLDEFIPLVSFQSNTREHGDETNISRRFQTIWADTSFGWDATVNDWQTLGWYQEADELSWAEAYSWADTPQLQRYTRHAKAAVVLSDSDPLSSTNATLGWNFGDERFDRDYHTTATDTRGAFDGRDHKRLKQAELQWLIDEPTWTDNDEFGLAGDETWTTSSADWSSIDWTTAEDWILDGAFTTWSIYTVHAETSHQTI